MQIFQSDPTYLKVYCGHETDVDEPKKFQWRVNFVGALNGPDLVTLSTISNCGPGQPRVPDFCSMFVSSLVPRVKWSEHLEHGQEIVGSVPDRVIFCKLLLL